MTAITRRPTGKQDEPPPRDPVADLLKQFGGGDGLRAKLHRESQKPPKRLEYLDTIEPVTPELMEDVKDQFGGGTYKAHLYNSDGYVQGGTITFTIAGRPKQSADAPGDDRLARIEARLLEKPPAEPQSAMTAIKEIIGVITPLAATLIPLFKSAGNGGSVAETLTLMQTAEERGERRGRTLGRLESGGGGESSMMDVAGKYLPPLLDLLSNRGRASREQLQPNPAPIPQNGESRTPPANEPMPTQLQAPALPAAFAWLGTMRRFYPNLAAQAEHDADPAVIADFALTQMDDTHLVAIRTAAEREDFREVLRAELEPIYKRHPQWVDDFLARIVEVATQGDEDEPEPVKTKTPTPKRTRK